MTDAKKLVGLLRETHEFLTKYRDPNDGFALYAATPLISRITVALAEWQDSSTVVVEPELPLKLRKGDKVEVRVTRAEDVPPATFSIGDPPLEVDPPEVWVLRFCDLVDIDGTTEEKRLEAFAQLYDHVKASRRAAIK